jgi:hypothetical protein
MKRPWLGYLSSALLFIAGILQILGGKTWIGILFLVLSVISLVLQRRMSRGA